MKEGGISLDVNLLNFLPNKFMLVSVKIDGKKEVPLPKKVQIPKQLHEKK